MDLTNIASAINQYGFPIIAAFGLGYFIYYIWTWVTQEVDPVVNESHMTLIALIDRIRMLDNDIIRLNTKLNMILQEQEKKNRGVSHENATNSDTNSGTVNSNSSRSL